MGSEDQALTVHSKKSRRDYHHSKGKNFNSRKYNKDIYINADALHVMKEDTLQDIVPRIRITLTRRKEKREYIMLML